MQAIAVTGYFATGSGAVYNLLQEYNSITDGGLSSFEHIFLYDVNGVFDTIDKILYSNRLYNSNAAINAFRREMKRLNNTDFNWFGGYKYRCGHKFLDIIEDFIDDITEYYIQRDWYGTYVGRKIIPKRVIKDFVAVLIGKKKLTHNFGSSIIMDCENRGEFSFATPQKIQAATKKLVDNYLKIMYHDTDKIIVLNHMLQPQDSIRMDYLPEYLKLIIVDRDIRDLYIYNKYTRVWGGNTFPIETDDFIKFIKSYRATEYISSSPNILRIQFEDLIYHYDNTVNQIEKFVGITSKEHIRAKEIFIPEKSVKNTQIFRMKDEWKPEINKIENELSEYIYNFPYVNKTSMEELFDA